MPRTFRPLHRLSHLVHATPWMIIPTFHRDTLSPQLISAMQMRNGTVAYDDGPTENTPAEIQAQQDARLIAFTASAAKKPDWAVNETNRRAEIPYNLDKSTRLGQIVVSGIIGKGLDSFDMACGGVCVDHLTAALDHLAEMKPAAIALHFNTPGGTVTGVPETADYLAAYTQDVCPVHGYTDTLCASAGYYLAASCTTFTAAPSADIGSIGVYSAVVDTSAYYKQAGIDVTLCTSGKYKGQGTRGVPVSQEYIDSVQADVNRHALRFYSHVATQRGKQIRAEAAALTVATGTPIDPADWASQIMQGQCLPASDGPACLRDALIPTRTAHIKHLLASLTPR